MKKKLLFLSAIIAALSLNGCNKNNPSDNPFDEPVVDPIDNQEEVDSLKALLNKQDLSPFYEKMFNANFLQDYSVYTNSVDEDEETVEFFRYEGLGMYGYYYSVSEDKYNEIMSKKDANPFDFISSSENGCFDLMQSADFNSFQFENDDDTKTSDISDFTYYQRLITLFDEENLQVYNSFSFEDHIDETKDSTDHFNGLVSKELLFNSISTEMLSKTIERVTLFDGQRSTEFLDSVYYDVCNDLLTKNDKELSQFIKTNHIALSEGEEYLEVSFKIEDESIMQTLADNEIFPGTIEGTLYYDKENSSFQKYTYQINFMDSVINNENRCVKSTVLKFTVEGFSLHGTFGGVPYIEPNPVVYDDGGQFASDMVEHIIPSIEID